MRKCFNAMAGCRVGLCVLVTAGGMRSRDSGYCVGVMLGQ